MIRAFQWDLGRQVERLDWLLAQLPRYAAWGYQEVYLHLEDAVAFPSFPGVARADAYSLAQFRQLVDAATAVGIGVVPIVNLLGHTQYLIKDPALRPLNELVTEDGTPQDKGQLCPVHPRTLEVADRLIGDMAPFATAGRLHVGLDESFLLGRHPLSKKEIAEIGLAAHFAAYVCRLEGLVSKRGLTLGIWGDMLALLPEAIPLLPRGICVYDWYYYPFASLPKMELYNFRPYDLVPALAAIGASYWGCGMNGAFRHEPLPLFGDRLTNLRSWWRRCETSGAEGFLSCSWEPNRLALDLTAAVDAAAASLWLDPDIDDAPGLLAKGLERAFELPAAQARALARLAIACDERPFSGYTRWEINQRWDTTSTHDGIARFIRETTFYTRALSTADLPRAFEESLRFRLYVAKRDVFVRQAVGTVYRLRRLLAKRGPRDPSLLEEIDRLRETVVGFAGEIERGCAAAQALWGLSRDPLVQGPNELLLRADLGRQQSLLAWIDAVRQDAERLGAGSPVCGPWQLHFGVILIEPALQKIVVEEEVAPGQWRSLHERFTIEFRSSAARRTTALRLEWSVPLERLDRPLRIAVRGLGRVAITSVEATNGLYRLLPDVGGGRERAVIGTEAPDHGFPVLDWTRNTGGLPLTFTPGRKRPL